MPEWEIDPGLHPRQYWGAERPGEIDMILSYVQSSEDMTKSQQQGEGRGGRALVTTERPGSQRGEAATTFMPLERPQAERI